MFSKILIANRGEIACRVMRTARKMGITTVAVYSEADANCLHVRMADEALCIGPAPARDSYLNIPAIIEAATRTQAQAIHPGYGFLSENEDFARACEQAGIVFIGPSVAAMQAMASKQGAKQLLDKTTVPLTPGYHGDDQDDARLLAEAQRIGFPVLLKAAAGGGGKGMRAVHQPEEFGDALAGARREAKASFADDTMIIEKLILNPRHIEVQIMADQQGQVVHLFERDCSIQRRHQKIIEEAPAPGLSPAQHQGLTQAACEVARAIAYTGAGTVEFLLTPEGDYYFMEMNTRLQVEHPITEMISGQDLVEWQIKIAAGQPLPLTQDAIQSRGHAIECRLYAEDPQNQFMPSIGQIEFLQWPEGDNIRIDTGIEANSQISQYYDPMIAKLICWGNNRGEAVLKMRQALAKTHLVGVKNNIAFLQAILTEPAFQQAELGTDFLNRYPPKIPTMPDQEALIAAAAWDYWQLSQQVSDPLWQNCFGWQSHLHSQWLWRYFIDQDPQTLCIQPKSLKQFLANGMPVELSPAGEQSLFIHINGHARHCSFYAKQDKLFLFSEQGEAQLRRFRWDRLDSQAAGQAGQLTAPMPATVVAILKGKGESVKVGDKLMVLEAMKMEHTIHAPKDGVLTDLYYSVGSQVNEGAELLAID